MAILKNTTISGTGNLTLSPSPTASRPAILTSLIQWTSGPNYTVLAGPTPTLTSTSWTAPAGVTQIEVLVVAGGGGGGYNGGGGGGGGGLIYNSAFTVTPGTAYSVTVGTGGAPSTASVNVASAGTNSVFGSLTAIGGGAGNSRSTTTGAGSLAGGSGGGGASAGTGFANSAGAGTTGQGTNGGVGTPADLGANAAGGGGGGAGQSGQSGSYQLAGGGGHGLNFSIIGAPTWYAGGGGGGTCVNGLNPAAGGLGGGGAGGIATSKPGITGTAGTGGGGGGDNGGGGPGTGGTGTVIIRYAVVSDATTPLGIVRYNSDLKAVEVYEGTATGWISQDPMRNFAGHNLLTYTEQLNNAAWFKTGTTISANAILAPDGTLTADKVVESATTDVHSVYNNQTIASAGIYTVSFYLKAGERTFAGIRTSTDTDNTRYSAVFNLSTGVVTSTNTTGSPTTIGSSIVAVGNGWYRCSVTSSHAGGGIIYSTAFISDGATPTTWLYGLSSYAGNGTSGLYVWGAQLENTNTAGPYTRTVDATTSAPTSLGGYRYHTYKTVGTSGFSPAVTGNVEVLVVGGGAAGGRNGTVDGAGGGGAGGVLYTQSYPVTAGQQYTVVVGAGGVGVASPNSNSNDGNPSQFDTLFAMGGGKGGGESPIRTGGAGGSGGGAGGYAPKPGGAGVEGQGFAGGPCAGPGDGGGGGAGGKGGSGTTGTGGHGKYFPQFVAVGGYPAGWFGGGGGASGDVRHSRGAGAGRGGIGGGGNGAPATTGGTAQNGGANTGGGGGGAAGSGNGTYPSVGSVIAPGSGGSGIVIVRYRYD